MSSLPPPHKKILISIFNNDVEAFDNKRLISQILIAPQPIVADESKLDKKIIINTKDFLTSIIDEIKSDKSLKSNLDQQTIRYDDEYEIISDTELIIDE